MWRRLVRLSLVAATAVLVILGGRLLLIFATNPSPQASAGWTIHAPIPHGRGETAVAAVDGSICVMGGLEGLAGTASATVDVYDVSADTWADGPMLPSARHHSAAAVIGSTVYLAGGSDDGWTARAEVWRLDPAARSWTAVKPMPEPRYGHRAVEYESKLYVVGGVGGTTAALVYDPGRDSWTALAAMPEQLDHVAAAVVGSELWVIGGRDSRGIHPSVHIYDLEADVWRAGPPLPAATSGAAEAAADDILLISGGESVGATGEEVIQAHWWIDTDAETPMWVELRSPPLTVHGVPGVVVEGRFYIIGGATRAGTQSFWSWVDATQVFALAELSH